MPFTRPRILIVDHEVDNGEMLPIWLDRNGTKYDFTTCYSSREARDLTEAKCFDLYILDYLMPDVTGAQLCSSLRMLAPNVPIIIYSAMNTPAVRKECYESGVDRYLLKPDDMDLLASTVEDLLYHRVKHFAVRQPQRFRPRSIV
ncbi:MAG TPA: response regulator [Pyrinomonadaceae bacterium]|jgi:OmpR-family two-component system manganese-sensing response regulator|nr:response regulator [Pyrinomonadaceae bacterium]